MNLVRQSSDDIWGIDKDEIQGLVQHHDPGKLLAAGHPPDEYDDEVAMLNHSLHLRMDYDQLFDFVVNVLGLFSG